MMNVYNYDYLSSGFDFLDLFDNAIIENGTIVVVSTANGTNVNLRNSSAIEQLVKSQYNFCLMSDVTTTAKWELVPGSDIPKMDVKVLSIGNASDAATIFRLAKTCRENINFYRYLYRCRFDTYDATVLSIATHIYQSPAGFRDFPKSTFIHQLNSVIEGKPYLSFDDRTGALTNYNGVNSIG